MNDNEEFVYWAMTHKTDQQADTQGEIKENEDFKIPENLIFYFFTSKYAGDLGGGNPLDNIDDLPHALISMFEHRATTGLE